MTDPASDPSPVEVRRLLGQMPVGERPTAQERDRIAERMWANVEVLSADTLVLEEASADSTESAPSGVDPITRGRQRLTLHGRSPGQRVLLWAAIALVAVSTGGLVLRLVSSSIDAADSPSNDATVLMLDGIELRFERPEDDEIVLIERDLVLMQSTDVRDERDITIARPTALFNGSAGAEFLEQPGLVVEPAAAQPNSEAWFVSLDGSQPCQVGQPCVSIAELGTGRSVSLEVGQLYRLEIHEVAGGAPVLVLSTARDTNEPAILPELDLVPLNE